MEFTTGEKIEVFSHFINEWCKATIDKKENEFVYMIFVSNLANSIPIHVNRLRKLEV